MEYLGLEKTCRVSTLIPLLETQLHDAIYSNSVWESCCSLFRKKKKKKHRYIIVLLEKVSRHLIKKDTVTFMEITKEICKYGNNIL